MSQTYDFLLTIATQNNGVGYGHFGLTQTASAFGTWTLPEITGSELWLVEVKISNIGAETMAITGSVDGTNFSSALIPIDQSTGRPYASAALGNGTFTLPSNWPFRFYKFTKSLAVTAAGVSAIAITLPE